MEDFLRSIEAESMATLQRLVDEGSFTQDRTGVVRQAALTEELFAPLGFAATRVRAEEPAHGDHLVLERAGDPEVEVMMVSHLDTVYPPGTPFSWREEGARVFGPGVCDIKGGTVLMQMVLRALQARDAALFDRVTWKLLFNAAEETGADDFRELARGAVAPATRACLVYEPGFRVDASTTTIAAQRKGAGHYRIDVTGREAHSGNDHARGASAVRELARLVERIEAMTDADADITFNVGVVAGGTAVNVVPGRASGLVDVRVWTPQQFDDTRARVLAVAGDGSVASRDGEARCRVDVVELPHYPPWPANAESRRLADAAIRCGRDLGLELAAPPRRGGSDGCHVWDLVPTLDGLGPVGANAHCSVRDAATGREPESVERDSFVPRALLSVALLREIAGS